MQTSDNSFGIKLSIDPRLVTIFGVLSFKLYFMILNYSLDSSIITPQAVLSRAALIGFASHFFLGLFFIALFTLLFKKTFISISAAAIASIGITAFAYSDLLYARFTGYHLCHSQLEMLHEGMMAVSSLQQYMKMTDILFFIDLPLAMLLVIIYRKCCSIELKLTKKILAIGLLISVSYFAFIYYAMGKKYLDGTYGDQLSDWNLHDLSRSYNRRKLTYPGSWVLNAILMAYPVRYYPAILPPNGLPEYHDSEKNYVTLPSIVYLQIESLAHGAVDWDLGGKPVMPFLRKLASENMYFPNTFSPHGKSGSADTDIGVLTGFHPSPQATAYGYRFDNPPYFPMLLRHKGYTTTTYSNTRKSFYNYEKNHKSMGIENFFETYGKNWKTSIPKLRVDCPGDRELLEYVRDLLLKEESPSFSMILTNSSHTPFRETVSNEEVQKHTNITWKKSEPHWDYGIVCNYVDASLREMIEPLRDKIDAGKLIIFIYGDHGPGVTLSSEIFSGFTEHTMGVKLVPLIIVGRKGIKTIRDERLVSLMDLPRTICQMLNIPFNYGDIGGRDMFSEILEPLITPESVFMGNDRVTVPDSAQTKILEYGYGKLGGRR